MDGGAKTGLMVRAMCIGTKQRNNTMELGRMRRLLTSVAAPSTHEIQKLSFSRLAGLATAKYRVPTLNSFILKSYMIHVKAIGQQKCVHDEKQ